MAMAARCSTCELVDRRNDRGHLRAIQLGEALDQRSQALRHVLIFCAQRFAKALADPPANSIGVDVVDLNIRNVAM
jgi:hypothetical protein